jgi:prevent-host-death family protein
MDRRKAAQQMRRMLRLIFEMIRVYDALTMYVLCVTMCHMKTISIRELHEKTGEYVRQAAKHGEIYVTDRGRTIAKIVPQHETQKAPYFAVRKLTDAFLKLTKSGKLRGGTNSTRIVSDDRDRSVE